MKLGAVLIDTESIQEYIFISNKLKENIGASHIVKEIYGSVLKEALQIACGSSGGEFDIKMWEKDPDNVAILGSGAKIEAEVGYIGGGNALILFKNTDIINNFIRCYTRLILQKAPGLRTIFGACSDFDIDNYGNSMETLHDKLIENRNKYFPIVALPKYGFTLDCPRTDESAEFCYFGEENGEVEYESISSAAYAKLEASRDASKEALSVLGRYILKGKYTLTDNTNKISQLKEREYVAVVHIDGNKMGERFKKCNNLAEARKLSKSVKEAAEKAFRTMTEALVEKMENGAISKENGFEEIFFGENEKERILPLRPIIIGGDDITFICDGALGVWLAETFIKNYSNQKVSDNKPLSACGGVIIVKTKYPFYKAYIMAKELTENAKNKSRVDQDSSYLDFFASPKGWNGNLEEFLNSRLKSANNCCLHFGPYKVCTESNYTNYEENLIDNLKYIVRVFKDFPKNKLMKLREVLFEDEKKAKIFVEGLKAEGLNLPPVEGLTYHKAIWHNRRTPYFDAIELLDFYPEELL